MARQGSDPMQALADLIGNITHAYTSTIRMVVIGLIVLGAIITAMFMYAAPRVAESVGERAERMTDKAIEAAREESRAHAMAQDGWGYSSSAAAAETDPADDYDSTSADYEASSGYDTSSEYADDWGSGAE